MSRGGHTFCPHRLAKNVPFFYYTDSLKIKTRVQELCKISYNFAFPNRKRRSRRKGSSAILTKYAWSAELGTRDNCCESDIVLIPKNLFPLTLPLFSVENHFLWGANIFWILARPRSLNILSHSNCRNAKTVSRPALLIRFTGNMFKKYLKTQYTGTA